MNVNRCVIKKDDCDLGFKLYLSCKLFRVETASWSLTLDFTKANKQQFITV